ncbi:MAG: hypothetical protein WB624_11205 [Xanthobacteraceae bacterium]
MKPIPDKVEIVLEYPDKFYSGTFERSSHFTAHFDEGGVALAFSREGEDSERKSVRIHIHNALFAEILGELGKTVSAIAPDNVHGDALANGASALAAALRPLSETAALVDDEGFLTPEGEVKLLHLLE